MILAIRCSYSANASNSANRNDLYRKLHESRSGVNKLRESADRLSSCGDESTPQESGGSS